MKINTFFAKLSITVLASFLLFFVVDAKIDENGQDVKNQRTQSASVKKVTPFDVLFGTLWPFEKDTISYNISTDRKLLTLNSKQGHSFGLVCWEKKVSLRGNRTIEIEVLDLGKSTFSSGKMIKVFILKVPGGSEIPLICKDDMVQSDDKEYVLPVTGTFRYSLEPASDDAVYKLGFVFYDVKLEGLKLKARFVE